MGAGRDEWVPSGKGRAACGHYAIFAPKSHQILIAFFNFEKKKFQQGGPMSLDFDITEKQAEFINADADEVLFGGAAGGGKSYGQLIDALLYALKYPGSKQLILRRTFPELDKSIIRTAFQVYPADMYSYNASKHTMTLTNKSFIDFGHCENDGAVTQYQSAEYDCIRFDELTHFTEYQYMYLMSRCRGANDFPKRMKSSTNPGGVGHTWVKNRFITIGPPNEVYTIENEHGHSTKRVFIPSFVQDNDFLMKADPTYVARLSMLPEKERRALLDGDWDIFEGQYFSEFRREIHVTDKMPIQRGWKVYRAFDYGLDMLACYWVALDYLGNAHVFRELYKPNLIVSQAARMIKSLTHESITATYAPPDMWNRRNDSGFSAADIFFKEGVPVIKAPNNRETGWFNVKEWLQTVPNEFGEAKPRLLIHASCVNLIRCLPELQTDKNNPNDASNTPHEITHAPDALRYFCAARTAPPRLVVIKNDDDDHEAFLRYGM